MGNTRRVGKIGRKPSPDAVNQEGWWQIGGDMGVIVCPWRPYINSPYHPPSPSPVSPFSLLLFFSLANHTFHTVSIYIAALVIPLAW